MQSRNSNRDLLKYAGLATQLFVALGIAVFIGLKLDEWLNFNVSVFVWALPLTVIMLLMYKIIKDTNRKK